MPAAMDPIARRDLIVADQVVAAVLRGWFGSLS